MSYRGKPFVSVLGPVRCERGYYHCQHCQAGHFPWDAVLGLSAQELTPGAEQLVSLAGCLDSFGEGHKKILPRMAGIRLAESTIERTTEAVGKRVGDHLVAGVRFGPAVDWKWHVDAEGKRCAYASVDATGVPQQGPGGVAADGRMPYVAMIYNPVPEHFEGKRPQWQARYLAACTVSTNWGGRCDAKRRRWAGTEPSDRSRCRTAAADWRISCARTSRLPS